MIIEVYFIGNRIVTSRKRRLRFGKRIRTSHGNAGHGVRRVLIVFQKAIHLELAPVIQYIGDREIVRHLDLSDINVEPLGFAMYFKSGVFKQVIFFSQHLVHLRCERCYKFGRLFEFKLICHILTLKFEQAVGIIGSDVAVEHIFQHTVISQFDIDPLPGFECVFSDSRL